MNANVVGNKGMVPFNRQVVDRSGAELGLADDGAKMVVGVNKTVVRTKRVNLNKRR